MQLHKLHIYYSMDNNITWNVLFDLLPLEMRWSTDPLYYMWSYSICHLSWARSARNVCEVACRSGTSEDPPLSADDSRCQPLYLSIPICILKVSAMKGGCDWGRTDDGAPGGVQLNWQSADFRVKYSKNAKSVRFCSPCGVSNRLLDIPEAMQLFCFGLFFSQAEQTPSPSCFPEPVLFGKVRGEHLAKFRSRARVCPGITPLEWKVLITCQFTSEAQLAHLTVWSLYDDSGWECTDPSVQPSLHLRSLSCAPGLSFIFSLP